MQRALLTSLGCAAVSALAVSAAQAQSSLFDELDAATETTVAETALTDIDDAAQANSGAAPFTFSALVYGAFATQDQSDGRFLRDKAGLEESGVELTFGFTRAFGDRLRWKSEIVLEARNSQSLGGGPDFSARMGESYLHFDLADSTWVRAGNLKLPHGTSDAFPILDLFNPRHDALWGIDHPSGQTLGVRGAQVVSSFGDFRFQLALGAGFTGDRVADAGLDHDYLIRDRIGTVIRESDGPENYKPEWVASLSYFGEGFDLSLMAGDVYEKSPVLKGVGVGTGGILLDAEYPRYAFAGVSGAVAMDSWLLRGDLGYYQNQSFFNQNFYADPFAAPGHFQSDVLRGVLGLEYTGISNTILSLELNRNVILDWDAGMRSDKVSDSIAANAQFSLFDDRLDLELTAATLANGAATILRAGVDYAINDNNSLNVQWVGYRSNDSDGFMEPYQDADRTFVGWTTSF